MRFVRPFLAALSLATLLGAQVLRPRATHVAPSAAPASSSASQLADTADATAQLETASVAPLRVAPDGAMRATVERGAVVTPLARERGWVQVRVDGWMRERDLTPVAAGTTVSLSAADLRADPGGTRGRTIRWSVQFLALQNADQLRRDLAPDEPYILARGPGSENALLYLTVPPSLMDAARALPPLASVDVTARVRTGRSDPTGVPILDLLTLSRASR